MAKSDALFLLVKSMTRTEKRYFKLNATKGHSKGGKDYLRLFEAVDTQKVYDEKAIRQRFRNEPYFKDLRNVKIYLRHQIIKSLKSFHGDFSCDIKLSNYLVEIELLFKKGLTDDCLNTIKKAKALAAKYEKFPKLLELITWEEKVASNNNDAKS